LTIVGTDTFTWTGTADGTTFATPSATVTIDIDTPPVIISFSKFETNTLTGHFALSDFTAEFSDADAGNTLQAIKIVTLPSSGTLALKGATVTANETISASNIANLTYTPNANSTLDSFTWEASDGLLFSNTATVTLNVLSLPTLTAITGLFDASGTSINLISNAGATNVFTANFTDPNANFTLQSIKITSLPAHGTLLINGVAAKVGQQITNFANTTLTYTAKSNFIGIDTFGWNGSDGQNYAASASTVTITDLTTFGVIGNNNPITNKETSPSVTNFTDFGSWTLAADSSMGIDTRTYTILNSGNTTINLSNLTITGRNAADFAISTPPATLTLAAGASTTFTVEFTPISTGKRTATITIPNLTSPASPFIFNIQGTGVATQLISTAAATAGGIVQEGTTQSGSGQAAANGEIISIKYTGYLATSGALANSTAAGGTVFDATAFHNNIPLTFRLDDDYADSQPYINMDEANVNLGNTTSLESTIDLSVISGWEFGLQGIKAGEKRTLVINAAAAYGSNPPADIPAGATLIFDVQCVLVNPKASVELLQSNNGTTFSLSNASTSSSETNTFFLFTVAADDANGTPLSHWNLTKTPLKLTGAHRPDFSFAPPIADTSFPGVIDINVTFHPLTTGVKNETLHIFTTDPTHKEILIGLQATSSSYVDLTTTFDTTLNLPKTTVISGSGQNIEIPGLIRNVGDSVIPNNSMTNVQIYAENVSNQALTLVGFLNNIDVSGLEVTSIKRFDLNIALPVSLPAGTYSFMTEVNLAAPVANASISGLLTLPTWTVMAQGGGTPTTSDVGDETMTNNDTASTSTGITVVQGFNTLGGHLSNNHVNVAANGTVSGNITVNVQNTGNIYTVPSLSLTFDLIAHPTNGGSDIDLRTATLVTSAGRIAPGGTASFTIPVNDTTATLTAGTTYLLEANVILLDASSTPVANGTATINVDGSFNSVVLTVPA